MAFQAEKTGCFSKSKLLVGENFEMTVVLPLITHAWVGSCVHIENSKTEIEQLGCVP
jgi:hypothetical protein